MAHSTQPWRPYEYKYKNEPADSEEFAKPYITIGPPADPNFPNPSEESSSIKARDANEAKYDSNYPLPRGKSKQHLIKKPL